MATLASPARIAPRPRIDPRRAAPTVVAAVLALVYVLVSPPSLDLAAHLFRAQLFRMEGFGFWNNWWYSGHDTPGYSVLFPPVSAALSPQLAAALAAVGTAALFEMLAYRHFGSDSWLGATMFAAATATNLFTGRLAFAFGALPAIAAVVALDRNRPKTAAGLAVLSGLCSPVAALFAAVAGAADAAGGYIEQRRPGAAARGIAMAVAALAPVGLLAIVFPEGGYEPFALGTLLPIPVIAIGFLIALPKDAYRLRAGVVIYTLGTLLAYALHTPVGSNAARFGTFVAAPIAALLLWPRRALLLAIVALPLLYFEWHDPIRDLTTAASDPTAQSGYYTPLLDFLERQPGPPFRVEIPFTQFHWEAYVVASRFPSARGWERQLDIKDNAIFYNGRLTPASYEAWLHYNAVRFVATSDAPLDYAGKAEQALIDRGLPYLELERQTAHWRIYEVKDATPIVQGAATLTKMNSDSFTLQAHRAGTALIRVHYTPYWALSGAPGCVRPAGDLTQITVRRPGLVRLVTSFALDRIGSRSPRCT